MIGKLHKLSTLTASIIVIFGAGACGKAHLCIGIFSGNGGFCFDPNNQTQVDLCAAPAFNIEGDILDDVCPDNVRRVFNITNVQLFCCVPEVKHSGGGGGSSLCAGERAGGKGFCIDTFDNKQVNICTNAGFILDGDRDDNCPSNLVITIFDKSNAQDDCCVVED